MSLVLCFFFGGATLHYHDPLWLVIEYTLYNGVFGGIILLGLLLDKPLLKPLFENIFQITDHGWKILSFRWGVVLLCTALLNEFVWHHVTPDQWVFFRLGASIALFLFCLAQLPLTQQENLPHAGRWGLRQ